jgi:hypothetical protein
VLKIRFGSALATAMSIALFFACGDALNQEELDCEEAVAHLEECCPGFDSSQIVCVHEQQGCILGSTTHPAIERDQTTCIRHESCNALVSSGVCDRAQAAKPYTTMSDPDPTKPEPTAAQVCP